MIFLFLRDLVPDIRKELEKEIEKSGREDLKKALQEGDDISVGDFYASIDKYVAV